jgi:ATP-dependent DNA helicase PIF1
MFDAKQLLPVVPGGDHLDIVKASLFSSPHWVKFQRHLLIENMRLQHIADPLEQRLQVAYDMMIRGIGENTEVEGLVIADELLENQEESPTHKRFTLMGIPAQNLFNADFDPQALQAALAWLYPGGYSPDHAAKNVVLATTNALVDEWNEIIAALNPNPEHEPLYSKDTFADVDDDHGHLKQMISDEVLQKYNTNDVPPHKLILKVGDVCLIMRNLNVDDGVTNNTRVVILKITKRYISCQTIGSRPVNILLPRIRFNFRLPYGQSFTMTRLQFPLRRAFCLSIHKSQGQTLQRALIDARGGFFAHGHLYVAMSRVTRYDCIAFFLAHHQFYFSPGYFFGPGENMHNKPFLANIVYPEAIQEIQNLAQAHQGGLA